MLGSLAKNGLQRLGNNAGNPPKTRAAGKLETPGAIHGAYAAPEALCARCTGRFMILTWQLLSWRCCEVNEES